MNYTIKQDRQEHSNRIRHAEVLLVILTVTILIMSGSIGHAQDTRVPAGDHPLAPAVGRLIDDDGEPMCTGWLTKGGILITAGHCKSGGADMIEFGVKQSQSSGFIVPSDKEDQYTISEWIDWNNGGKDDDWAIFKVADNEVTGLQPIEAQIVYIDLQQDLTGDVCRTFGYGRDYDQNTRNFTLQMDMGDNETASPTSNIVKCMTYGTGGNSGGPIIDDNTNKAIGLVKTANYSPNRIEGTSTFRSSFWNTFQGEQTPFTLTVTQKDEGSSVLTGSIISRWDVENEEFDNHTLTGFSINFGTAYVGNVEIFRGDQGLYNNPQEKYNEWTGFSDIRNHKVFHLEPQQYISQFKKTHSDITISTFYPEYTSANGSGQIQFKDPWLIDYNDPDFDNSPRNRGMDAVFYSHSAPFNPGFNTINGKLYNGLFLNENENFLPNLPNYSVRAEPQTINFGGALGSRQVAPIGWEGDDVGFEDPNSKETAVVFTDAGAEARSKLKISRISNDATAYANNSQRKVVRTSDGWLHMVYESLGRVWLEHSDDDGATWTLGNNGRPLDNGAGKNPSIDWLHTSESEPDFLVVVYQQKNGSSFNIIGKIFSGGSSGYYYHTKFNYWSFGSTDDYSVDANPTISWGANPGNGGGGEFVLTIERKSESPGIYYVYGSLEVNGVTSSSSPTYLPGTNANSTHASVNINKSYTPDVFHIVYQQGTSTIKHKFIECDPSGSSWYCSNTYTANLSSSTGQQNYKPSMVQMPGGGIKVSWIRALYGQSSPYWMNTVYWSTSSPSQYTIRGYFVRSVSLNISDDHTKYLYAWSEQINSWYANYLSNGSSNTKLSTSGEEVQLSNGTGSGANMLVSSFNRTSTPYTFKNTGNIGSSLSKVSSDTPINYGRGVALHKDDLRFNYTMKSLSVDNKNIKFVEIPQDKPDSAKSNGRWGITEKTEQVYPK